MTNRLMVEQDRIRNPGPATDQMPTHRKRAWRKRLREIRSELRRRRQLKSPQRMLFAGLEAR